MPRHPALAQRPSILSAPLSRDSNGSSVVAIAAESFVSSSRSCLHVSPLLWASPSLPRAPPSSPPLGWPRSPRGEPHFPRFVVVGFMAVATPTPANLAAAPSLPPFFSLYHVRTCLGHHRGLCHAIPALVTPSSGNTAAVPPRSPPTTTPHVSRLTGAVRVRLFYLGSFALSHWCLSRSSRRSTGRRWPA